MDYTLWNWPETWEIVKGHPTVIDPNDPQMSNITCKYCGRVFNTVGSKMKHETASQKTPNNICRWNTSMNDEQKLTVKFVPPIDDDKKQEIANWYFNTNNFEDMDPFALEQYNKLLTTKEDFDDDKKVSAEGYREDWSNLPEATLKGNFTSDIFGTTAASSQAVLDDDEIDDFPMDDFPMDDFPMGEDPLVDFTMGEDPLVDLGERSSFEEFMGGRRKTRKKRRTKKKRRKTRKKIRKNRRKTRKKKRKKRRKTRKKKRKGR